MLEAKTVANGANVARPKLIKPEGKELQPLSKIIVNGVVAITPELALRIILECGYERQRGVRPMHVSALAVQMRRKEWTPGTQIHFAKMTDGWLRLIDGQHRLHAVVEANTTVIFQVLVTDATNETEVARLYRRHDRLSIHRTIDDVLKAEGIPGAHEITVASARGVFNAVLVIGSGFAFSSRSARVDPYLFRSDEARLRLCEPWWPVAVQHADAISKAPHPIKKFLTAQGPLAVALVTLRDQEAKADAFWRGLANNDGLKRDDPRSAYLRYLAIGKARAGFWSAKAASVAWNAFYDNRELDYVRLTSAPVKLAGCDIGA